MAEAALLAAGAAAHTVVAARDVRHDGGVRWAHLVMLHLVMVMVQSSLMLILKDI